MQNCLDFNPFRHVVHGNQDKFATLGSGERPNKIDAPNVTNLTSQYKMLRYLIPFRNIPYSSTLITQLSTNSSILKESRLIEITFKYLPSRPVRGMVSSRRFFMTLTQNFQALFQGYTTSNDVVGTYLEQVGIIPKLVLGIRNELPPLVNRVPFEHHTPH